MKYFISFPSSKALNPFVRLLNEHLARYGWLEYFTEEFWLHPLYALQLRNKVSLLHFHWPESIWRSKYWIISLTKACIFIIYICYLKLLGYKIVFSYHNRIPHFGKVYKRLERLMRKWLLLNVDLVVGHSDNVYEDILYYYRIKPKQYVLARHGMYDNYLNSDLLNSKLFKKLSLVKKTKLYVSYSRNEYKGSHDFIKKYIQIAPKNLCLVLSGNVPQYVLELLHNSQLDYYHCYEEASGVKGFLTEESLVTLHKACDYIVLPYKEITTSGAYFLSLTFDKPVIAPDLPFFTMVLKHQQELLYQMNSEDSLVKVLEKIHDGFLVHTGDFQSTKSMCNWSDSSLFLAKAYDRLYIS